MFPKFKRAGLELENDNLRGFSIQADLARSEGCYDAHILDFLTS